MLLRMWRRPYFHGINAMILMPQIFDVIANENARYKRNELEFSFSVIYMTAQLCRRIEEAVPTVGLPTPETFRRVL